MAQNDHDELENGVIHWHPLGHALISHVDKQGKEQFGDAMQQGRRHGIKFPSSADMNTPAMFQGQTRLGQKAQRPRNQSNWAYNGTEMQAVFLGSKKSCGTGVFIPRGHGIFSSKPDFSPVLLPSRVVQTLNLNVHDLGQHIKPQPGHNESNVKKNDEKLEKKRMEDDVSFSPENFLPEEWTY